jgi:hypothetical protein
MKSKNKKKVVIKPKKNRLKKNCISCKKIIYDRQLCCACYLSANNVSTTYNCMCSSGKWCDYCYGEIDLYD